MAQVANPRKGFNFTISAPGLNPFLAQVVETPDWDIDVVEHGDTNHLIKTGGLAKVGLLKIDKISIATGSDNWIWNWYFQVQDVFTGGGDLPSNYKRTITVEQLAPDGVTVINTWVYYGSWPSKINNSKHSRTESQNNIESIELCVDEPDRF